MRQPLAKDLRSKLEKTVVKARDIAEQAVREELQRLGVGDSKAAKYLTDEQRSLRNRLRAHGRQLGDRRKPTGEQPIEHLVTEAAYEHWHRMLFARFLAENNLLMYEDGVTALAIQDCFDLAEEETGDSSNGWQYAANFAAKMLPQIFRIDSPVFTIDLPPNHQKQLEQLLAALDETTFQAQDSLGWVYQFWQSKKKEAVNKSEVKIGADELPAVTQLFTEPYMVSFLLDNALGAWWVANHPDKPKPIPLKYLRMTTALPPSPSGRGVGGEGETSTERKTIPQNLLKNARKLRENQTDAEQFLWGMLRDRRFENKKFRRQHPVGHYILDFYCHELKLAIELDGGQHNEKVASEKDLRRSQFLAEQGIEVLRFWNNDLFQKTDSVLEVIYLAVVKIPSPPSPPSPPAPLPEGEGSCTRVPAAGCFDAWPKQLSELKVLDPSCGSGHFLVEAFLMLVPMRMAVENLSASDAVDAVLNENIHGLELDQRCVELAAFALALTAWRYPDAGGYRPLPELHLACSGLGINTKKEQWLALAEGNQELEGALDQLHELFKQAPTLGSLIDPNKVKSDLFTADYKQTVTSLQAILEKNDMTENHEVGIVAQGMAKSANLLAGKYHWVITNVPYLARGKQSNLLREFCEHYYSAAKNDLATVFLDRCLEFCEEGGTTSIVLPQNWLFLISYKKFREKLLTNDTWQLIARLGAGAFDTISGEVVKAILITMSRGTNTLTPNPSPRGRGGFSLPLPLGEGWGEGATPQNYIRGVDVSELRGAAEKATGLLSNELKSVEQAKQLDNPDARVALEKAEDIELLQKYSDSYWGLGSGDYPRFGRVFWEKLLPDSDWIFQLSTILETSFYGAREHILYWQQGEGDIVNSPGAYVRGTQIWGGIGIHVSQMRNLPVTIYTGECWDSNSAPIIPKNLSHLPAIWCFCSSPEYNEAVRRIDQKLNVTNATLVKVPFDLEHWTKVANEKYPNGLPKPYSDDPTQWIFHGHPAQSDNPLQVAVARLLNYQWPAESDTDKVNGEAREGALGQMELSDETRRWIDKTKNLADYVDDDGIVCLSAVRGEKPAHERLEALLHAAYGDEWTSSIRNKLLEQANCKNKTLDVWLREKFFEQHCKLFQHRPFIWHIWDGLKDGFSALVNYHLLDKKNLERLIYTYLDDWIRTQSLQQAEGIDGATERLAAAETLKQRLEQILEGEAPYDIFVRWKPLEEQAIGWNPDINDGVRLNIRPFLTVTDVAKKGAGILRAKPNIHWKKDRGKDVESAPWYKLGLEYDGKEGDRINDHHLSLEEKHLSRLETDS